MWATIEEEKGWEIPLVLVLILGFTAYRIWALWQSPTDLFVDEAQYWLWAQDLQMGYYSKPPMIAWIIHGTTHLAGSDSPFWIRLPAPIFHALTAVILMALAQGPHGARVAAWTGLVYITLPAVAAGSAVMSTDTVLFPFFAAALLGWDRLTSGAGYGIAIVTGLALGLAFLSKYAALYFWLGAVLGAMMLNPPAWPGWGKVAVLLGAFLAVASPNLLWNWNNGALTLLHLFENAAWSGAGSGASVLSDVGEFVLSQFAFIGPVLFAAYLWVSWQGINGGLDRPSNLMLVFSVPILLLILLQAVISRAYANWAAVAYLSGVVVIVAYLHSRSRAVLWVSLVLNGAVALAAPWAFSVADTFELRDTLVLKRLMGRAELSDALLDTAERSGVRVILSSNRDILADLAYTGRDRSIRIAAYPSRPGADNHYTETYPYRGSTTQLLWVREGTGHPGCPARKLLDWSQREGAYSGKRLSAWLVSSRCRTLPDRVR